MSEENKKMGKTRADQVRRSSQNWERGKGASKKGNPRYTPKRVRRKDGSMTTVYKLRKK